MRFVCPCDKNNITAVMFTFGSEKSQYEEGLYEVDK